MKRVTFDFSLACRCEVPFGTDFGTQNRFKIGSKVFLIGPEAALKGDSDSKLKKEGAASVGGAARELRRSTNWRVLGPLGEGNREGADVTTRLTTLPNGQGVGGLDKIPSSKVFGPSCITCIQSRPNDKQRTLLVLLIADLWALWNEALQKRLSGALHLICSMWNFQCHRPSAVDAFPGQA